MELQENMKCKNSRVLKYLEITGTTIEQFKEKPWEYSIWCINKWREFANEINVSWEQIGNFQDEFDKWLETQKQ